MIFKMSLSLCTLHVSLDAILKLRFGRVCVGVYTKILDAIPVAFLGTRNVSCIFDTLPTLLTRVADAHGSRLVV